MRALDLREARRVAVRAQLLDAPRPKALLAVVERLTLLQIDPTAAVAPNADLVAWSRLGSSYDPATLRAALDTDRTLFELNAMVRPMADLPIFRPEMAEFPRHESQREWLRANDSFRRDVLALLAEEGPLLSRDIPDTSVVSWPSSGWTNNRNVTQLLELLTRRGEVAIAGRRGKQRLWDVPGRVYPPGLPDVPPDEARHRRHERKLRSLGITRGTWLTASGPDTVGEVGEEVTVDGLPGTWRVDPELVGQPFTGRTALLSPFDRLVHDRVRAAELFGFEYVLEMYKPKAARRWGYFALPVLHHDLLVGKVDATADRKVGVLRVDAIHEDVPFTKAMTAGVRAELDDLAAWLGLELGGPAAPVSRRTRGTR